MSRSSPWQPWVDGDLAARAREAVDAVAADLLDAPGELPAGAQPEIAAALRASLASGQAGQALFYAYLSLDGEDEACSERALALSTGEERLATAGRRWLARALAYRTPGCGAGGYRSWETRRGDAPDWRDDRGFLEGAAGVGLALLAAVSTVEPEWDRALLLSAR